MHMGNVETNVKFKPKKVLNLLLKNTINWRTILYHSAPAEARALDCDALKGTFKCVRIKRHKQVSTSGFPRHPLLSNVYVIEITTPRAALNAYQEGD